MKVKHLFENFGGGGEGKFTPDTLKVEQFIELVKKHSPKYLNRMGMYPILRGTSFSGDFGYIDTNGFTRTSANTHNYYTLWIDNSPEWADYPKRSKSLICTNSYEYTYDYGDTYFIIPEDNAKIGICPHSDMWYSFEAELKYTGTMSWGSSLDMFMMKISDAFTVCGLDPAPKTFGLLSSNLKKMSINMLEDAIEKRHVAKEFDKYRYEIASVKTLIGMMGHHSIDTLYDAFAFIIDPKKNNFKVSTASQFDIRPARQSWDREVWVQGKCLLIKYDLVAQADLKEDSVLNSFIQEYNIDEAIQ